MLEEKIKKRLAERLQDSHVSQVISEEMAALCAEKPASVSIETFGSIVAQVILKELHDRLIGICEDPQRAVVEANARVEASQEQAKKPQLDFESILHGLLSGMDHDILLGNLQMIRALGGAVAVRDTGTSEHVFRVTLYSAHLGIKVGLDSDDMQALMKGSFLHDIGKIGIADDILCNPGKLTPAEQAVMQSHTEMGWKIICGVKWLEDAEDVVRYHHERYDGEGYPEGLKGEQIPLKARIFAIADVFDALTSRRMYKDPETIDNAIAIMRRERGKHFDPGLFDRFVGVANELYKDLQGKSVEQLETMTLRLITRLFGVNPTRSHLATDKYRQPTGKN